MNIRNIIHPERINSTAHAAVDYMSDVSSRGIKKLNEGKEKALEYACEHPLKTAGIGLLTGCVAGYLAKKKIDSED